MMDDLKPQCVDLSEGPPCPDCGANDWEWAPDADSVIICTNCDHAADEVNQPDLCDCLNYIEQSLRITGDNPDGSGHAYRCETCGYEGVVV